MKHPGIFDPIQKTFEPYLYNFHIGSGFDILYIGTCNKEEGKKRQGVRDERDVLERIYAFSKTSFSSSPPMHSPSPTIEQHLFIHLFFVNIFMRFSIFLFFSPLFFLFSFLFSVFFFFYFHLPRSLSTPSFSSFSGGSTSFFFFTFYQYRGASSIIPYFFTFDK